MLHSTTLEHMQNLSSHCLMSKKYQNLVFKVSAVQNKSKSNFE